MNKIIDIQVAVRLIAALVMLSILSACVAGRPLPPPPSSSWGERYSYRYEPPQQKGAASVPATIVVVNPSYKEAESAFAERLYSKVAKGFSASMGVDMDKVVIAKGMTVKGPYATLDEITYSDKKGSDLTLAPKVFITTHTKHIGDLKYETYRNELGQYEVRGNKEFEMNIGGWIAFIMQEPLSGEKMWVKRLELEDTVVRGIESYETTIQGGDCLTPAYRTLSPQPKLLYDGKVDALADVLKNIYPMIMEKCWIYIDADEILSLKEKVKEIRTRLEFRGL